MPAQDRKEEETGQTGGHSGDTPTNRVADIASNRERGVSTGAAYDVSRMCPATDRKNVQTDGQCRSPKLLVRGTFGCIRYAPETG